MYTTYVIRSKLNGKRYVGSTSKTASQRLLEHNRGTNKWTRQNRPFILIHCEKYPTNTEAIKRERFLKSGQGRKLLDEKFGQLAQWQSDSFTPSRP